MGTDALTNATLLTLESQIIPRLELLIKQLALAGDESVSDQITIYAQEAAKLLDLLRRLDPAAAARTEGKIAAIYKQYHLDQALEKSELTATVNDVDDDGFAEELRRNLKSKRVEPQLLRVDTTMDTANYRDDVVDFGDAESKAISQNVHINEHDEHKTDLRTQKLLAEMARKLKENASTGKKSSGKTNVGPVSVPVKRDNVTISNNQKRELTDDEARRLLAEMDAPLAENVQDHDAEMTDDEAKRLLADMDAPFVEEVQAENIDMTDDEAKRLLAEMDAPNTASTENADIDEITDDQARRLLAEMDAPVSPKKESILSDEAATLKMLESLDETTKSVGLSKPKPEIEPVNTTLSQVENVENQSDNSNNNTDKENVKTSAANMPINKPNESGSNQGNLAEVSQDSSATESADDLTEIDEFSNNDFASDPEMINDFMINSDELMETLDEKILELEQKPDDKETIEAIFRAAHTLKGAAGMFGFKAIERVMHRMENLFDKVRKGTLHPDSNIIDVVFQGLDVLKGLLGAVRAGKPSGIKTVPIVRSFELAIQGKYVKDQKSIGLQSEVTKTEKVNDATKKIDKSEDHAHENQVINATTPGQESVVVEGDKKKDIGQSTIRVDLERLDALVNLVGELVIDRTRFASIEESFRTTQPQNPITTNMSETVQLFGRHMNEIHEIIMKIRMVPIGNAFNKFPRIVRDLARQLGKEIEIVIEGEDTELDKTLVEQIGDPLIHLIRNSCDHGIETPDVRQAAGKASSGKITLSARQEGNHIIITIEDDGKGLDVDRIRRKGIERGLITEDTALERRDIFNLIFEPGFSTAETVTTVSGRGVGMDVVRRQISKLKGVIDLNSETGKGTVITIRLPLTLAIVQSLLVESRNELFAIPLSTVIESVRITPDEIQKIGETEVIRRHGKVLPLLRLDETLDLNNRVDVAWYSDGNSPEAIERQVGFARSVRRRERIYVVIVGSGERRFGIVVDQLLHQQEMVIKSLGPLMRHIPCVAGGAVLGNGEVVLVIDIQELEMYFRTKNRSNLKVA